MQGHNHQTEPGSLHALVLQSLDDDQAQDIISISLAGKSVIADHMVIASGRSTRQVTAMAQKLAERIKHGCFGHVRIIRSTAGDHLDAGRHGLFARHIDNDRTVGVQHSGPEGDGGDMSFTHAAQ